MKESGKIHWKQLMNTDYIGAYSLQPGEERTVQIIEVSSREIKGEGGKKDKKPVATLVGEKPFIINSTNAKTLTKIFGTPYIDEWKGKRFTLIIDTIKDKVTGEDIECLRIKPTKPTLPELSPNHPKWKDAIKSLSNGTATLEKIEARFSLSEENRELLISSAI